MYMSWRCKQDWTWDIELVNNPDRTLMQCDGIVVTSDGMILDNVQQWFNLSKYLIDTHIHDAQFIHLGSTV